MTTSTDTEGYYFTLPRAEGKRIIFRSLAIFATLALVLTVMSTSTYLDYLVLIGLLHAGAYYMLVTHKYVYISADGIRGEGYTGRYIYFAWPERILIDRHRTHGLDGYAVSRPESKTNLRTLFIPRAIAASPQFHAVVNRWAPADHPLLSLERSDITRAA